MATNVKVSKSYSVVKSFMRLSGSDTDTDTGIEF